jgi:hypothetical protein
MITDAEGDALQKSSTLTESLSSHVMALCAVLARILYRRLTGCETRTVHAALDEAKGLLVMQRR